MSVKTAVILRLNLFCMVIDFNKYRIASYRLNSAYVVIWNGFQSSFLKTHLKWNLCQFFFVSGRLRASLNMTYFVFDQIDQIIYYFFWEYKGEWGQFYVHISFKNWWFSFRRYFYWVSFQSKTLNEFSRQRGIYQNLFLWNLVKPFFKFSIGLPICPH